MNFLVLQTMHLHKIQKYFDELRVLEGLDDCLCRHYIVKIMDFLKISVISLSSLGRRYLG